MIHFVMIYHQFYQNQHILDLYPLRYNTIINILGIERILCQSNSSSINHDNIIYQNQGVSKHRTITSSANITDGSFKTNFMHLASDITTTIISFGDYVNQKVFKYPKIHIDHAIIDYLSIIYPNGENAPMINQVRDPASFRLPGVQSPTANLSSIIKIIAQYAFIFIYGRKYHFRSFY